MAHPSFSDYNPIIACHRVTEEIFEHPIKLRTSQLTLPCKVLYNIIAHVIFCRKGHLDEATHFNLFLLHSFLVWWKLDFPTAVFGHMEIVHCATRIKALLLGMLLTKIFKHFEFPLNGEIFVSLCITDIINTHTLKHIKLWKKMGNGWLKLRDLI